MKKYFTEEECTKVKEWVFLRILWFKIPLYRETYLLPPLKQLTPPEPKVIVEKINGIETHTIKWVNEEKTKNEN